MCNKIVKSVLQYTPRNRKKKKADYGVVGVSRVHVSASSSFGEWDTLPTISELNSYKQKDA